jgi:hypothetical protein
MISQGGESVTVLSNAHAELKSILVIGDERYLHILRENLKTAMPPAQRTLRKFDHGQTQAFFRQGDFLRQSC